MGSGTSGLYSNTYGARHAQIGKPLSSRYSERTMAKEATNYIEQEHKKLDATVSKNEHRKFNTACVVCDSATGAYYYGRNGGLTSEKTIHPTLKGDDTHPRLLPKTSAYTYNVFNCAEIQAVNSALWHGAKLENLYMITMHAFKRGSNNYQIKSSCKNCTHTLKSKIRHNYSGWED